MVYRSFAMGLESTCTLLRICRMERVLFDMCWHAGARFALYHRLTMGVGILVIE